MPDPKGPDPATIDYVDCPGYTASQQAMLAATRDDGSLSFDAAASVADRLIAAKVAKVAKLVEKIALIHDPVEEEVELYCHDTDRQAMDPPPCSAYDDCAGHAMKMLVCSECGYTHDGDYPLYRHWPCPTVRVAAALAESEPDPGPERLHVGPIENLMRAIGIVDGPQAEQRWRLFVGRLDLAPSEPSPPLVHMPDPYKEAARMAAEIEQREADRRQRAEQQEGPNQ